MLQSPWTRVVAGISQTLSGIGPVRELRASHKRVKEVMAASSEGIVVPFRALLLRNKLHIEVMTASSEGIVPVRRRL